MLLALILVQSSCKDGSRKSPEVSELQEDLSILRLEDPLMAVRNAEDYQALDALDSLFIAQYKTQIMVDITGEGRLPADEVAAAYVDYATHPDIKHLYEAVKSAYPDLKDEEQRLSKAFAFHRHYFPNKTVPRLISYVSPFNAMHATTDETLGIGLDMYLGSDFEPYYSPSLQEKFPQYKIDRCRRDYIVVNTVKAWLLKEFEMNETDRRLISHMIYEGKILYALDLLCPDEPDSLKIGYHKGKIEWCEKNEYAMWHHLIENNLLYSNEFQKFSGILMDGPFSKGMNVPPDSPPMIAIWTGWQIVRKYMAKNPEVTLEDLLQNNDAEKILKQSGYKP